MEELRRELAFSPDRLRSALKTGLACTLGFWAALGWRPDHPYWLLITILIVSLPTYGASVEKGVLRIGATLVGMTGMMGLIAVFAQAPTAFILSGLALVSGINLLGRTGFYPPAAQMATVYTPFLAVQGVLNPLGAPAFLAARCVDTVVGVGIAWLVNRLVWPVYAGAAIPDALAESLRMLATRLREPGGGEEAGGRQTDAVSGLLDRAGWEVERESLPRQQWESRLVVVENLASAVWHLRRRWLRTAGVARLEPFLREMRQVLAVVASELEEEADKLARKNQGEPRQSVRSWISTRVRAFSGSPWLRSGRSEHSSDHPPHEQPNLPGDLSRPSGNFRSITPEGRGGERGEAESRVQAAFQALRRASWADPLPAEQLTAAALIVSQTEAVLGGVRRLREPPNAASEKIGRSKGGMSAQVDRTMVIQALKPGLGMLLTSWVVLALGWNDVLFSAVVSAGALYQATIGASSRRLLLRLGGCLLGGGLALAAIIWVIPHLTGPWGMSALLGGLMTFSAYLYFSSERYNYIGMQTGLVVLLVLDAGYGPSVDLAPVWSRLEGILLAAVMVGLVARFVYPVRSYDVFRGSLARWLAAMRRLLTVDMMPWRMGAGERGEAIRGLDRAAAERKRFEQLWLEAMSESRGRLGQAGDLRALTGVLARATLGFHGPDSAAPAVVQSIRGWVGEEAERLAAAQTTLLQMCERRVTEPESGWVADVEPVMEAAAVLREKVAALRIQGVFRERPDEEIRGFFVWLEVAMASVNRLRDVAESMNAIDFSL